MPAEQEKREQKEKYIRPAAEILSEQRHGLFAWELSVELNKAAEAVMLSGKSASVTIKLTIKPAGKNAVGTVFVTDEIITKLPKELVDFLYFTDGEGNMSRKNERQLDYGAGPLLEVPERSTDLPRES